MLEINTTSETLRHLAQSAVAVEYTDYFSAEGLDFSNEYPVYDTKQSHGEARIMHELLRHHSQTHSGAEW